MVSIIIPCYNDAQFIEEAVLSAISQTFDHTEIIIVDDGSNEETKLVLKSLINKVDKIITQDNRGVGAARNVGIEAAIGNYILLLDADDFFEPEFLKKAIGIFNTTENIKVVTCWAKWFRTSTDSKIFKPTGGDIKEYLVHNAAIGTSIFKKDDWQQIGGYDERMKGFEDWEFYIRLHKNGGNTYVIPEVLFNYRKKNNSRNSKANSNTYELFEYIYLKHADLYRENYESLIKQFLFNMRTESANKVKFQNSIEYKIGHILLKPLRKIKNLF